MRVTPLICWHCSNWFQPITRRKNKYCSNACRQQGFHKNTDTMGYETDDNDITVVRFKFDNLEQHEEYRKMLLGYCDHEWNTEPGYNTFKERKNNQRRSSSCVLCFFEKNFKVYSRYVAKYGRDWDNKSMKEWLSEKA